MSQEKSPIYETLNGLQKATTWVSIALLAVAAAIIGSNDNIQIAGLKFPREAAGVVLIAMLCGVNFHVLRLLHFLSFHVAQITGDIDNVKQVIRHHHWPLNPFSESAGPLSYVVDTAGYAVLLLLWWLGAHCGYALMTKSNTPGLQAASMILNAFYLIFGLLSMLIIQRTMNKINSDRTLIMIKRVLFVVMIPVGAFGIGAIINPVG